MSKRMVWLVAFAGCLCLGLIFLASPEVCYACASQTPPPNCTANMSSMTLRQADDRKVWWNPLDRRAERTLNVYLGLNMNGGSSELPYNYTLIPTGAWQPTSISPITGTGVLKPGENNTTIKVTLPYSDTDRGDLQLAAQIDSPCPFSPQNVASTIRINEQGPTVWPITSRSCPVAGEKPVFRFGVRNPSDQPQTYKVTARAITEFGGDHTPILAAADDAGTEPGVYEFPEMTLKPGQSKEVKVTCETFGFCLTGSENRVNLEVLPGTNSSEQFPVAMASSNVTVRDPNASCPSLEDWWFIMPPTVFWGLLGAPVLAALVGATAYLWPTKVDPFTGDGSGGGRGPSDLASGGKGTVLDGKGGPSGDRSVNL